MALAKTQRYSRHTYGDDGSYGLRNIVSTSFSATDIGKRAAASTTAFLPSTAGAVITNSTGQPKVPRTLTVTTTGAGTVVITGMNSEGAVITESFVAAGAQTVAGVKAFATITSVNIPGGISASVGSGVSFGINDRTLSTGIVRILCIPDSGTPYLEVPSSSTLNASSVELNIVTPTTTPNDATNMRVYVLNYNWHVNPINGQPNYGV